MQKMAMMRSLSRSIFLRSLASSASAINHHRLGHGLRYFHPSAPPLPFSSKRLPSDCRPPFAMAIGSTRFFSEDVTHLPKIKDPEILIVFKDLMAASWDELPDTLIHDAKKALSKNTDDQAGQEALANIFRAAEAAEEFSGILVS